MIRDRVVLRLVENSRRVRVVVMRPVRDTAKARAGAEVLGLREERHQRDESAVAPPVHANALGVDAELLLEVSRSVHVVLKVASTHPAVDGRAPVAPVSRGATIVEIEYDVALRCEVLVEHVLARIR